MKKNNSQIIRFGIVGAINTVLDFGLLFILHHFGLAIVFANIVSTSVAFCVSFFANKKYTFKSTDTNLAREMVLFIVVTLFGLWVIQNGVIVLSMPLVSHFGVHSEASLFVSKLIATGVTLVWNYLLYSRLVFNNR